MVYNYAVCVCVCVAYTLLTSGFEQFKHVLVLWLGQTINSNKGRRETWKQGTLKRMFPDSWFLINIDLLRHQKFLSTFRSVVMWQYQYLSCDLLTTSNILQKLRRVSLFRIVKHQHRCLCRIRFSLSPFYKEESVIWLFINTSFDHI